MILLFIGIFINFIKDDDEDGPSQEDIQKELSKWVKRSTIGSFISMSFLISWIVIFQVYKEKFSPSWLVYSPSTEVSTGW